MQNKCQRCSECANSSHHWISNPDFGNDPEDSENNTEASHVCKHCDALAMECDNCDGNGCGDCDEAGVNEFFPFENQP